MSSKVSRLPSRFPVGTRFVIEGQSGLVHMQYLEFPDGRRIQLPADVAGRVGSHARRRTRQKAAIRKF